MTFLKVVLLSKTTRMRKHAKTQSAVILGNGPSLTPFLSNHADFLEDKELWCVNFFGRTQEYTQLKPKYYVIASPEYFVNEKKEEWVADRMRTLKTIADQTSWSLFFFVPQIAKKNERWLQIMKSNELITPIYYNNTPVEGWPSISRWLFKKNWGMPRPHNVLIPSLMMAIREGYKKVYLTGADHSWTKELFVTDKNEVLLSQKHFYDKQTKDETIDKNKPVAKPMYKGGATEARKLHEVLEKFQVSFRSYWVIQDYADKVKCKIINLTPQSFIDAFDREKL